MPPVRPTPKNRTGQSSRLWKKCAWRAQRHPREEHLIPLMVAAGAAGEDGGARIFHGRIMGAAYQPSDSERPRI